MKKNAKREDTIYKFREKKDKDKSTLQIKVNII